MTDANFYMRKAIETAQNSGEDLPVGAIIVRNNEIISVAHNEKEAKKNSVLHAEIVAIQQAQTVFNDWHLNNCAMFVTLEPCPMCAWAIIQSQISVVYFGATDSLYGSLGGKIDLRTLSNSNLKVFGGICETECSELIKKYMKNLRNTKK